MLQEICLFHLIQKSGTFSLKGQVVNVFGFVGHMVSVTTIQPCCHDAKAAGDDNVNRCVWLVLVKA